MNTNEHARMRSSLKRRRERGGDGPPPSSLRIFLTSHGAVFRSLCLLLTFSAVALSTIDHGGGGDSGGSDVGSDETIDEAYNGSSTRAAQNPPSVHPPLAGASPPSATLLSSSSLLGGGGTGPARDDDPSGSSSPSLPPPRGAGSFATIGRATSARGAPTGPIAMRDDESEAPMLPSPGKGVLPEYDALSESAQREVRRMLSHGEVSTYDYPQIFRLDELTGGHPLLFMSWAILASPHHDDDGGDDEDDDVAHGRLLGRFGISPSSFADFVRAIESRYEDHPFHNSMHAADVFQTLHAVLRDERPLRSRMSDDEILSLLLAAIVHDVGHDGTTNEFHVQRRSELAARYRNRSVLENYHAEVGIRTLVETGLLDHLPRDRQVEIRERISQAILNTDMAVHAAQVEDYRLGNLDDWQRAMYLMHLCDISNPAKSSFSEWADRVFDEFFRIGDRQRALGLPVTPSCDRTSADRAGIQRGFLMYIVIPAFDVVEFRNPAIMERLHANFDHWTRRQGGEDGATPTVR